LLRNKLIDAKPDINETMRDGNAVFGGAFAITSKYAGGDKSSVEGITDLFSRFGYVKVDKNGNRLIDIDPTAKYLVANERPDTFFERVKKAIDRGNPVILSTSGHIRLAIGYDDKNNIITHDPYNDNKKTIAIAKMDGKFVKYPGNISFPSFKGDNGIWKNLMEFTPVKSPVIQGFTKGAKVKSFQKFSDDPIDGLNARSTPGGSVVGKVPWKTLGTIIDGPKYGGTAWAFKVRWSNGVEGWSSEEYIKPENYTPQARAYNIDVPIQSRFPDGVNIRDDATVGGKLIKFQPSFRKGRALKRVDNETDYNWYYIEWEDGTKGWSVTELIDLTLAKPQPINKKAYIKWEDGANLRDVNTTDSSVIQLFKKGVEVNVLEEAGNANGYEWVKVSVVIPTIAIWEKPGSKGNAEGYMTKQALSDAFVSRDEELITKNATYITSTKDNDQKATPINVRETANGTSKIIDTLNWNSEVKIIDGVSYSYGYNRVKVQYTKPIIGSIGSVTKEGWIPLEFLVKK
jgi:uncharacterized protein YgiM (DUF1202 family)